MAIWPSPCAIFGVGYPAVIFLLVLIVFFSILEVQLLPSLGVLLYFYGQDSEFRLQTVVAKPGKIGDREVLS